MKSFFILLLLTTCTLSAQNKYLTRTGNVSFEASIPSFEEVAAKNKSVTAILNMQNGEIAALALIKGFRFKNALMEEHFNENYAESDRYPKATFKGTIINFDSVKISTEKKTVTIKGIMEFHGVTTSYDNIELNLCETEKGYNLSGEFIVNVEDFKVKIPNIVKKKVSDKVLIKIDFILEKQ